MKNSRTLGPRRIRIARPDEDNDEIRKFLSDIRDDFEAKIRRRVNHLPIYISRKFDNLVVMRTSHLMSEQIIQLRPCIIEWIKQVVHFEKTCIELARAKKFFPNRVIHHGATLDLPLFENSVHYIDPWKGLFKDEIGAASKLCDKIKSIYCIDLFLNSMPDPDSLCPPIFSTIGDHAIKPIRLFPRSSDVFPSSLGSWVSSLCYAYESIMNFLYVAHRLCT